MPQRPRFNLPRHFYPLCEQAPLPGAVGVHGRTRNAQKEEDCLNSGDKYVGRMFWFRDNTLLAPAPPIIGYPQMFTCHISAISLSICSLEQTNEINYRLNTLIGTDNRELSSSIICSYNRPTRLITISICLRNRTIRIIIVTICSLERTAYINPSLTMLLDQRY
jgi:hypothetical protein